MGDDTFYDMLKDEDETAIAVKQMKDKDGPQTLHSKVNNEDDTINPM